MFEEAAEKRLQCPPQPHLAYQGDDGEQ